MMLLPAVLWAAAVAEKPWPDNPVTLPRPRLGPPLPRPCPLRLVLSLTALPLAPAQVGLCCSNSKLNCSCPKPPPVVWAACPRWHVGNNTIGSGVYDASGVLLQPDGTWHMWVLPLSR